MRKLINENTPEVLRILLKELGIKYTNTTIDRLKHEPYFPYIDSIGHALTDLGVKNITFKTSYEKLIDTVPGPFIAHLSDYGGMLLVVKAVTENRVIFAMENGKYETQTKEEFLKKWSGYILMIDAKGTDAIEEENYKTNLFKKIASKASLPILILFILGFLGFHLFQLPINFFGILFSTGILIGIVFNILILVLEIDQNNPFINNICSSLKNKKLNCSGVLSSKGASFYGLISWSQIGIIYFSSLLALLLVFKASIASLTIVSLFSLLAFSYPFYSIYYQWKVAKNWCKLCLFIQTVLLYLFTVSIFHLRSIEVLSIDFGVLFFFFCILLIALIVVSYVLPFIKKLYTNNSKIKILNTFKYDPRVFSMFWKNERQISLDSLEENVISYGEKNGKNQINIIINPTCNHCIIAHNELLKILERDKDIHVNEVFFVPLDTESTSYKIALKMMDIYLHEPKRDFLKALKAYYQTYSDSPKKWMKKYWRERFRNPRSEKILDNHRSWCEEQELTITPLVTLNNLTLPRGYGVQDLRYFL